MSDRPGNAQVGNEIYTILLVFATALVAGATVYLAIRSQQLFGSWNPFSGA